MITLERLKELLAYNPETGLFTRKTTCGPCKAGQIAGCINHQGYRQIAIDGKIYKAHRLAWFLTYREWPANQIDHINNFRADNKISNLRKATASENTRHSKVQRNNKSAIKGLHYVERDKLWRARVMQNGKYFTKYFKLKKDAITWLTPMRKQLHGEFTHHG